MISIFTWHVDAFHNAGMKRVTRDTSNSSTNSTNNTDEFSLPNSNGTGATVPSVIAQIFGLIGNLLGFSRATPKRVCSCGQSIFL